MRSNRCSNHCSSRSAATCRTSSRASLMAVIDAWGSAAEPQTNTESESCVADWRRGSDQAAGWRAGSWLRAGGWDGGGRGGQDSSSRRGPCSRGAAVTGGHWASSRGAGGRDGGGRAGGGSASAGLRSGPACLTPRPAPADPLQRAAHLQQLVRFLDCRRVLSLCGLVRGGLVHAAQPAQVALQQVRHPRGQAGRRCFLVLPAAGGWVGWWGVGVVVVGWGGRAGGRGRGRHGAGRAAAGGSGGGSGAHASKECDLEGEMPESGRLCWPACPVLPSRHSSPPTTTACPAST